MSITPTNQPQRKSNLMELPQEMQPAIYGFVCGAVAVALIGFTAGGWVTGSAATEMADKKASTAVASVLAPICADNFKRSKDAAAHLVELKNAKTWEQGAIIAKGGWAAMPGTDKVDTAMASSCAAKILAATP